VTGEPQICFVVEDEPAIRRIITYAVHDLNFVTREFDDANNAVRALAEILPRLIFLDVSLKNSDAIDLIRALGNREYRGTVQLVSGKHLALLEEIRSIGARHGLEMLPPLTKPFRPEAIREIVQGYLDQNRKRPEQLNLKQLDAVDAERPAVSLERVLTSSWLEFWYQPKIDLRSNSFAGVECLARARHPEWGVIPAQSFIASAEEGSLLKLSQRVLTVVLRDWDSFYRQGINIRIAVNIPIRALVGLNVAELIRECRPKSEKWPGIIIEITEDQAVADWQSAQEIATQLKIYGVSLSIDDFGAGYSHFARIRQLPFSELKIDKSLVANCAKDAGNRRMCEMAIELAHQFGIPAVAEGIESRDDLHCLKKLGCDLGQGFLFAPALPREDLVVLLRRHAKAQVA
jgi:EAL domain-containing protein (putative c-di-GMP-specific phosphodiesterase class I)/CheY-like chemotaxis protein